MEMMVCVDNIGMMVGNVCDTIQITMDTTMSAKASVKADRMANGLADITVRIIKLETII